MIERGWRLIVVVVAVSAMFVVGCGDSSSNSGSGGGSDSASDDGGCLSSQEVQKQIAQIANGIETSDADVAAKQAQIKQVQAQECK